MGSNRETNMAWYDRFLGINREEEKENHYQYVIARNEGLTIDSREVVTNYRNAYEQLEVVNRAVNMIVTMRRISLLIGTAVS